MKQEYSLDGYTQDAFKSHISNIRSQVETELGKLVTNLSKMSLHPKIEYAALSEGKRLRPLLAILSAESVGGNREKTMPLALAFELMHTATLVHDDIIDQDEIRRGKPTVHKKWSVNDAILTGDALIALSVNLASAYGETIMKSVAQSALELCDGENIDITFSLKTANEESYFRKIRKKSASLFRAATYCGALAGGSSPSEAHSLAMFGENFGIAYQLEDDILDLTSPAEPVPADLKSVRLTLPLIYLYEMSDLKRRDQLENELRSLFGKRRNPSRVAVKRIQKMLRESGAIAYCEKRINEYVQKSINSLTSLKDNDSKFYLIKMAESLIAQ